jgi:hypothetical protein
MLGHSETQPATPTIGQRKTAALSLFSLFSQLQHSDDYLFYRHLRRLADCFVARSLEVSASNHSDISSLAVPYLMPMHASSPLASASAYSPV